MVRLSKTKKLFIVFTVLVLFALALYIFLFLHIAKEGRTISALKNDISVTTEKEGKLRSVQAVLRETEDERARLDDYFIAKDGVVSFIELIEAFGGISGAVIDVSTVDVGPLVSKADTTAKDTDSFAELILLSFKVNGIWQEVLHTFALLESLPYKISITSVTLRTIPVPEEEPQKWQADVTLTVVKKK